MSQTTKRKSQTDKSVIIKKRCAIYTRKSTEEGLDREFNSLDAQRESCEAYIASQKQEGWELLPERYDDGGFSGGNLERPALTQLMDDIRQNNIDIVAVYKIDRISRSLMDFAKLADVFDEHNVSFVSITQHFNTATSMGRLILNILLSFAQFEREVISERIRDKLAASKRKGMWMGGVTPMGYVVKDRHLELLEEEVKAVRAIFQLFIESKSPTLMVKQLPAMGIVSKKRVTKNGREFGGKPLDTGGIYKILNNPIYIGKIKHHDNLYDGRHAPLISQETWDATQSILRDGLRRRDTESKRRSRAVLTGILQCGGCYRAMTPTYTAKEQSRKLYRYYVATGYKKGTCPDCPIKQVAASEMEARVLHQVQRLVTTPDIIMDTYKAAAKHDNTLTDMDVRDALQDIAPIWNELFPAEQHRLLSLMIDKVILYEDHLDIQVRSQGLTSLVNTIKQQDKSCP